MNSLINQKPLLIISSPNHKDVINRQVIAKIRTFFRFVIFLNFRVIQYTKTEIPVISKPTGPFVRVASPIEIPAKRAYLNPFLSPVLLMLFARNTIPRKIKNEERINNTRFEINMRQERT